MAGLGLHGRCWTEPAGAIYRNRIQIRYYPSLKWVKKGAGRRKKVEGARPEPLECQNVTPCQAATHWGPPRRICNSEVPTPQEDWNTRTISVAFSPIVQLAGGYLLPSQGENGNDMRKSRTDPFLTPFGICFFAAPPVLDAARVMVRWILMVDGLAGAAGGGDGAASGRGDEK